MTSPNSVKASPNSVISITRFVSFPGYGFTLEPGMRGHYIGPALGLKRFEDDLHKVYIDGISGFAIWLQPDEFIFVPAEEDTSATV